MRIIDIEEVRENLEELIDEMKPGERFAISVDGDAKVEVIALSEDEGGGPPSTTAKGGEVSERPKRHPSEAKAD